MPGKPGQQVPAPYAPVIVAKSGRAIPQPHTADVFAILGIGCWVVAAVIGSCVVFGYSDLVSSDYRIGEWFDSIGLGNAVLVKAATVWHYAGGPGGSFVLALVATVWLFIANRRGWALYVVVCGIGGLVISEVLKKTIDRARPSWPDPAIVESGGSFPSGHSMAGIYVWAVVGIVLMYLLRRPLGTVIGWCLIVFGILMAPSRLILGVHWPSDVVGGWMLALGWVLLVSACAVVLVARRNPQGRSVPDENQVVTST